MEKLAIFGVLPLVVETLTSPCITCGPKVKELEQRLCKFMGAKYDVAFRNMLEMI